MNKIIKEEKEILKCVVCGEELPNIAHDACPNCTNKIGFSIQKVNVTSIGKLIKQKQMSEDTFAFVYDFETNSFDDIALKCYLNTFKKPFLGVKVFLNSSNGFETGEVHVAAVFRGTEEFEVDLSKEQVDYLTQNIISNLFMDTYTKIANAGIKEFNGIEDKQEIEGLISLEDIADAMYSITSDEFKSIYSNWDDMSLQVKIDMAKTLQKNTTNLVDLINCTKFGYSIKDFSSLKRDIETIIELHYPECLKISKTTNSVESIEELSIFDKLQNALESKNINFNIYDSFDVSNLLDEYKMISVVNLDNNECLHIVNLNEEYVIIDNVKEIKGYKRFDLKNSNNIVLNLDDIMSLIDKMGLYIEDTSLNSIDEDDIEEILSSDIVEDFEMIQEDCSDNHEYENQIEEKELYTREAILKQLHILSDEDIFNELKRRLSTR